MLEQKNVNVFTVMLLLLLCLKDTRFIYLTTRLSNEMYATTKTNYFNGLIISKFIKIKLLFIFECRGRVKKSHSLMSCYTCIGLKVFIWKLVRVEV